MHGLGLLPGSHCPHYDTEPGRRPQYQALVASGQLPAGYALDEAAGLLFERRRLAQVIALAPGAQAYRVSARAGRALERALPVTAG